MTDNTPTTHITAAHQEVFNALTSGEYNNFALFSCYVDGEPAAAIVAINQDGEEYQITPLFVSVTDTMQLTDHDGAAPCPETHPANPPL